MARVSLSGNQRRRSAVGRFGCALLNQGLGKSVGYLNPDDLSEPRDHEGTFRDITSGNNGHFKAAAGWDPCTGWGSPVGTVIQSTLKPLYKKKK